VENLQTCPIDVSSVEGNGVDRSVHYDVQGMSETRISWGVSWDTSSILTTFTICMITLFQGILYHLRGILEKQRIGFRIRPHPFITAEYKRQEPRIKNVTLNL
jgi:hypothetical protein